MIDDPSKLPCVKLEDRKQLPAISGIYFAMQQDEVLYVGLSGNIRERWKRHHKTPELIGMDDIKIHWIPSDGRPLIDQENEYIKRFRPPMNWKVSKYDWIPVYPDIRGFVPEGLLVISSMLLLVATIPVLVMSFAKTNDVIEQMIDMTMILFVVALSFFAGGQFVWRLAREEVYKMMRDTKHEEE